MTSSGAADRDVVPLLVGVNHLTTNVDLRDKLLLKQESAERVRATLLNHTDIDEVAVLSTCHRAEIHAASQSPEKAGHAILEIWSAQSGVAKSDIADHAYSLRGEDALRHLFRVSASLDSIVIGESQVFGQVKEAYESARSGSAIGITLDRAFQSAIRVGKRVRTETTINEGAVSISYAAVELARKIFGDLSAKTVGIIGSGEMGRLAARHLQKANVHQFVIFNRSAESAQELAAALGGDVCLLDRIHDQLHRCDVVVSATDAPGHVLTREMVQTALRARSAARLFLIDISAPRDIEPTAGDLPNTYLFTIDDLKHFVGENEQKRQGAVADANAIIEEELVRTLTWYQGLQVRPLIQQLRHKYERIAADAAVAASRNLSPEEQQRFENFSRSLLKKFLHTPLTRLKEIGEEGNGKAVGYYANELFGLSNGSGSLQPDETTSPADEPSDDAD